MSRLGMNPKSSKPTHSIKVIYSRPTNTPKFVFFTSASLRGATCLKVSKRSLLDKIKTSKMSCPILPVPISIIPKDQVPLRHPNPKLGTGSGLVLPVGAQGRWL